jgi:hypothetical protein
MRSQIELARLLAENLGRAIPVFEADLAEIDRKRGKDHPSRFTAQNNLALAYEAEGDMARAIPLYAEILAGKLRVLGPGHPDTAAARNSLDNALKRID